MFPHRNIHKFVWTTSDGKTQLDEYSFIDRRIYARFFRGTDCDTDHYLVVINLGKDWQ
jgi:hypothetical protein